MPKTGKKVDVKECVTLYKTGLSMGEVGRRLGHHHSVIKYHLVRNGVHIRPQNESQRKPFTSEQIAKMYLSGMSAVEIAKALGATYQCVYDRLAEVGVKTRKRRDQIKMMLERGTYNAKKGLEHKNWKGGISIDSNGYRHINVDGEYIPEHRLVWEKHHGKLMDGWVVHHLNGDKLDNRLKNLAALPRKAHSPKSVIEPFRLRIKELEKQIEFLKQRV